jgi:hypothetical protein
VVILTSSYGWNWLRCENFKLTNPLFNDLGVGTIVSGSVSHSGVDHAIKIYNILTLYLVLREIGPSNFQQKS